MSSAVVLVAGGGKYRRSRQMPERTADDTERQQTRHGKPAAEEAAGSSLKKCPIIRTDRSAPMTSYRVDFMNEFARNTRIHKVCQCSIVVRSARSPEQAGEAAKTHFARLEGIRDWRIHAATIEVVPIEDNRVSEMNVPAIDLPSGGKPALSGTGEC
jgi:hypothetical protein